MNHSVPRTIDWKKYAAVTVSVSAALFAFWILLKYGIRILMPFLLAWVLSLLITPLAEGLSRKTKLSKKLCALLILILALAILVLALVFALNRLFREIEGLFLLLGENPERLGQIIQQIVDYFSNIAEKIPFLSALQDTEGLEMIIGDVGSFVTDFLKETVSHITAGIPSLLIGFLKGLPEAALFLLVFFVSAVYFSVDGDRIYAGIQSLLPSPVAKRTVGLRRRLTSLLYRYLRVYLLLFLITFIELLIGFLILGREYAFLLALLISALDVLPVLGVGTILVPWAVILFLLKDFHGAIGLLILWGIITIVRQIVEPRLIGGSFGMHPLIALVALYAGLKLFGFIGILLGPALAVFLKLLVSEIKERSTAETDTER